MKLDELILLSGIDVPFPEAQVTIHPPHIKEIALLGEENFLVGSHFLLFNKDNLADQDKVGLENQSNFHIFMSVVNSREKAIHKLDSLQVLTLLFPQYEIKITQDKILLQIDNFSSSINESNFDAFQRELKQILCLGGSEQDEDNFNPADALAKKIADKIKKGKQKRNEAKGETPDKIVLYSKYASILAVGLQKDINELMDYTIYQLFDEFKRYQLKQGWDTYIAAKLAGAEGLEEVENWMEDIHP